MSASLVGSEMCIRDSPWPDPATRQGGARSAQGRCPSGRRFSDRRRSGSVSYTHLTLPTICSV
eukprot:1495235-Alexandrium_andersonii.AAC.1